MLEERGRAQAHLNPPGCERGVGELRPHQGSAGCGGSRRARPRIRMGEGTAMDALETPGVPSLTAISGREVR